MMIVAMCVVWSLYAREQLGRMLDLTETIESEYRIGNRNSCERLSKEFLQQIPAQTRHFHFFLPQTFLRDVTQSATLLPLYLESEEPDDFLAEVSRCRLLLKTQYDLLVPQLRAII